MKIPASLFILILPLFAFSQMRPIGKVYIVEGIVADIETFKTIPSAILYNDSLGITTTSDENGYFKIVVPYDLVKNRNSINIDIVKPGYKRNGSGFKHNPDKPDTSIANESGKVIWEYNVKLFLMAKNESTLSSTSVATSPLKEGEHGSAATQLAFNNFVAEDLLEQKFDQLKEGNENVYFPLDSAFGFVTRRYDIIVTGKLTHVFLNDKEINLAEMNKQAKRTSLVYDKVKSGALTKKYGIETLAFVTTADTTMEEHSYKAILYIEVKAK